MNIKVVLERTRKDYFLLNQKSCLTVLYEEQIYFSDTFFLVNDKILMKFFIPPIIMGLCLTLATLTKPNPDTHLQSDMTAQAQPVLIPTGLGNVLL